MQPQRVNPILNVSNLAESFAWFEKFGFKKAWAWGDPPEFGSVTAGRVNIFLCENGQGGRGKGASKTTFGPGDEESADKGVWMSIWVDNVDDVNARCLENNLEISQPPADYPWNVREMHVRHPDGHVFRVSQSIGRAKPIPKKQVSVERTEAAAPRSFEQLEQRIRTILPAEYQDHYEDVQPVSMGSASIKYGPDGKVPWDDIWESFCDLAMAGGPPHKGALLEPARPEEIAADPERYRAVVTEICRGINLVTALTPEAAETPGWIQMECGDRGMAEWLVRAIAMENVATHFDGDCLFLPAGPHYRIEKEIKNVITAVAKSCHYWIDHMWLKQQNEIADLFGKMAEEHPLIQPALDLTPDTARTTGRMAAAIRELLGLEKASREYVGWLGVECKQIQHAIWLMRAMAASNVLARREQTTLFVPVNPVTDPGGATVVMTFARVFEQALAHGSLAE